MSINIREILRRLVKYIVLVLVVGVTSYSVPENKITNNEIIWIALLSGLTYCILDIITPTIKLTIEKQN